MKVLVATLVLGLVGLVAGSLRAHEETHGPFDFTHPSARFTPPGAPNGAVYMVIENTGKIADRLIGASTPRAERVEFHASEMDGELMTMRPRESVEIGPDDIVAFEPGGLHVMLFKLSAPLKVGERFPLTLRFEKAGELTITVEVERDVGDDGGDDDHHHHEN